MYPLQPRCELENQLPGIPCVVPRQPDQILNDPPMPVPVPMPMPMPMSMPTHEPTSTLLLPLQTQTGTSFNSCGSTTDPMGKQKHKPQLRSPTEICRLSNTATQDDPAAIIGTKEKRIMHRDIERQRRQEMAGLYASLRSLLPLEYIKGKRAISDHMHEAVNYIKCLETNIRQLRARRDKLQVKMPNLSSGNVGNEDTSFPKCTNITVSPCPDGVEILMCTSPKDAVFPLSRVLQMLLAEGLNVVCCVSTTVSEIKVHKIRSEVSDDQKRIDPLALKQKLTNMVDPLSNSEMVRELIGMAVLGGINKMVRVQDDEVDNSPRNVSGPSL